MRRRSFVQLIFGGCVAAGCAVVAAAMPRMARKVVPSVVLFVDRHDTVGLLRPVDETFTYGDSQWTECRWTGGSDNITITNCKFNDTQSGVCHA